MLHVCFLHRYWIFHEKFQKNCKTNRNCYDFIINDRSIIHYFRGILFLNKILTLYFLVFPLNYLSLLGLQRLLKLRSSFSAGRKMAHIRDKTTEKKSVCRSRAVCEAKTFYSDTSRYILRRQELLARDAFLLAKEPEVPLVLKPVVVRTTISSHSKSTANRNSTKPCFVPEH